MKRIAILLSSLLLLLTGCGGNISDSSYEQITQEAAKEMMDTQEVIVLDTPYCLFLIQLPLLPT